MAQSIKLGNDTYLDASGVTVNSSGTTLTEALAQMRWANKNISGNSSEVLNCPNSGKALLLTIGAGDGISGAWLVNVTGQGIVTAYAIKAASSISLSGGTNSLTITNSASGTPRAIVMSFTQFTFS